MAYNYKQALELAENDNVSDEQFDAYLAGESAGVVEFDSDAELLECPECGELVSPIIDNVNYFAMCPICEAIMPD